MHHHLNSFYFDTNVGEFLFPGLNINGVQPLLLLCLVLVFLTLIFEAVKVYQTKSRSRTARERLRASSCPGASETANLISNNEQQQISANSRREMSKKFLSLLLQAVIFLFQNSLGYILMLTVMVYNGYVFIVVVLGMGLGYFLFGHISMKTNMENIRARTTNVICSPKCPNEPTTSGSESASAQQGNQYNRQNDTNQGYVNELFASTSSSSDDNLDINNDNINSSCTKILNLDKDVEIHMHHNDDNDSNIIQSCRL